MKLKLIAAIAVIAAIPAYAQAQPKPAAAKVTKADAQRVVQSISADKGKTAKYCELAKLMEGMQSVNAESKEGKEIGAVMEGLDKLCGN